MSDDLKQPALFEPPPEEWRTQWRGMPEFVQDRQRPYATIIVRFRSEDDLQAFAQCIGQRLNQNSQCTWYPELRPGELGNSSTKYVGDDDEP